MIDGDHELPVSRQAELLKPARSTIYYRPRPVSPEDLAPRTWRRGPGAEDLAPRTWR